MVPRTDRERADANLNAVKSFVLTKLANSRAPMLKALIFTVAFEMLVHGLRAGSRSISLVIFEEDELTGHLYRIDISYLMGMFWFFFCLMTRQ